MSGPVDVATVEHLLAATGDAWVSPRWLPRAAVADALARLTTAADAAVNVLDHERGLGVVRSAEWDRETLGITVARVECAIAVDAAAAAELAAWSVERASEIGAEVASARIPVEARASIAALEGVGFRFAETTLEPWCELAGRESAPDPDVREATISDALAVEVIAETAFTDSRFFTDPRFGAAPAERLFRRWAGDWIARDAADEHALVIVADGEVAGFVLFRYDDLTAFGGPRLQRFLLGALGDGFRGRGLGERLWRAMLAHGEARADRFLAGMSAGNLGVLRLYQRLGINIDPGYVTLHRWSR